MNQSTGFDDADEWVDAETAADRLGVKRETLYAYVSRGRVESRRAEGGRRRTYRAADLERLAASRDARAGHTAVAAGALRWGEPVLDSAITEITARGPAYRGRLAVELAEGGASYESVAGRLIDGDETGAGWDAPIDLGPASRLARLLPDGARPLDAALVALPAVAMRDPARFATAPEVEARVARRIVRAVIASFGLLTSGERAREALAQRDLASSFAIAFGVRPTEKRRRAIEATLVLCADHELNASCFGARVTAAAGADLYACAIAALATLSGARHGGVSERVVALCHEVGAPERATRVVRERMRRGEAIPGFGHPLYPEGDPRAAPLLALARDVRARALRPRILGAVIDTMDLVDGGQPNLDVGLVAVADALGLPDGGAAALFAGGRAAGWLAHAIEQRRQGHLLRPRARYVGP